MPTMTFERMLILFSRSAAHSPNCMMLTFTF